MWMGIGAGVLVLLVVTPIVVGMLLPERFTIDLERRIDADREAVWAALHDPDRYPVCTAQCKGVTIVDGADRLEWREDLGETMVTYRVVEEEAPRRMVVEASDSVVPLSYRSETTLDAVEGGTLVTTHVDGRIASGTWHVPIFRLIIHAGGFKAGFSKHLDSIERGVTGG